MGGYLRGNKRNLRDILAFFSAKGKLMSRTNDGCGCGDQSGGWRESGTGNTLPTGNGAKFSVLPSDRYHGCTYVPLEPK